MDRDSSDGVATRYGLDDSENDFRWGAIICICPDKLLGPPSLLYNGYQVFAKGYSGQGVELKTHLG